MTRATAKLFQNGRSQAVRLPKQFRFGGTEVLIWREGERVVLQKKKKEHWKQGFWDSFVQDADFPILQSSAPQDFSLDE